MGKTITVAGLVLGGAAAAAAGSINLGKQASSGPGVVVVSKAAEREARQAVQAAAKQAAKAEKQAARAARQAARAARQAARVKLPLPPLDLRDMKLWNWNGIWHASEWNNPHGALPWHYDHVGQQLNGDTVFTLDSAGAPELQPQKGTPSRLQGLWEADVTLPQLRDGVIVAPLWLYDTGSRDEIDFEFAGKKGLDVTMHVWPNGVHKAKAVRLFAGQDFSGRRVRFGIEVDQEQGVVNMYVDRKLVHSFDRDGMEFFVSKTLKPWFEMWAANPGNAEFVRWSGRWNGIGAGDRMTMTVHGYQFFELD